MKLDILTDEQLIRCNVLTPGECKQVEEQTKDIDDKNERGDKMYELSSLIVGRKIAKLTLKQVVGYLIKEGYEGRIFTGITAVAMPDDLYVLKIDKWQALKQLAGETK